MAKTTRFDKTRTMVTFESYETTDANGKTVVVPAYTNIVRTKDLDEYVARIEAERARKPATWSPS